MKNGIEIIIILLMLIALIYRIMGGDAGVTIVILWLIIMLKSLSPHIKN